MSLIVLALLVVLVAVLVARAAMAGWGSRREGLEVSPEARQIAREAGRVFRESGGNPRYQTYKREVLHADPVQFTRMRELFRSGGITPERVQAVM